MKTSGTPFRCKMVLYFLENVFRSDYERDLDGTGVTVGDCEAIHL